MKFSILVLVACAVVASACGDNASPTAPSLNVPFSATDITVGTGTTAASGQTVRVYYTGWLYSETATDHKGTQFDAATSGLGFSFRLGAGAVIKGWDQGIVGMKVGGKRRLIIPPDLAYGSAGAGSTIPGNATLIFEVELLSVAG
jgi:FKBP-type peptidyl-prolyl cis-trans isomerase FkpA